MPFEVRTNSGLPKWWRSLASATLTAGCPRSSASAAAVTLRVL